jgi:hypothetical protein
MNKMKGLKSLNEDFVFILEKQSSILESKKNSKDEYLLEGIAAVFGKENNNHRIYEENEYLPHLDYLQDKIKQQRLLGELDHPEKFDISLKNISHLVTDLNYNKGERTLKIKVKLLDTPAGRIAKSLVDAGIPLSISSRAAGSVGSDKKVQIKKIFTYDLVADPGFKNAQLERVYESCGYSHSEYSKIKSNSIVNHLECLNESLGLKNQDSMMIYRVDNEEEFEKLLNKKEKTTSLMERNNEFVTSEELDQYSVFLKKEMDSMKSEMSRLRTNPVSESNIGDSDFRISKLEKYAEYLAESLENTIKYNEYLAENLDKSISYSKYLAENVDKNISYSKYLAENMDQNISYTEYLAENLDKSISYSNYLGENVDKNISYTEYVAESVDKNIEYSKYLAEKLDQNVSYSEYLAENVDTNISYTEYLAENLDNTIKYTEYLAENVDNNISYSEHIAENLNNNIAYSEHIAENVNNNVEYSEYLGENLNNGIEYTEYLAEKLGKSIEYSEYIAESMEGKDRFAGQKINENVDLTAASGLKSSGYAGSYTDLSSKIDSLLESVQTQKTEATSNKIGGYFADTLKAPKNPLFESAQTEENSNAVGIQFIDEMPDEYKAIWESLNEGHQQSIVAQSHFYNLETSYQIRNFWSTRNLGASPVGLQKLEENEMINENQKPSFGYSNDYMNYIAESLGKKFNR